MANYYLFQQNMHVFDGSSVQQNKRYNTAMQTISGYLKTGRVVAAGFTEIMNNEKETVAALNWMGGLLDPELTTSALFATGVKLLPDKTAEYISIGLNKSFDIAALGRVMLVKDDSGKSSWMCVSDTDVSIGSLSDNFQPNSRGLAYVCGTFGDQKLVVGFTHNITGSGLASDAYTLMANCMTMIWTKHSDYNGYPTVFGGDFPFTPSPVTVPVHNVYACAPAAAANPASDPDDDAAPSPNIVPLATTNSPACDFWVTDENIPNSDASMYGETWNKNLSDHAGIAVRLDAEIKFGA